MGHSLDGLSGPGDAVSPETCLRRLAGICKTFQIDSLSPQVEGCREALQSRGVVDVVVLGRFKAGKSSFLNSLMGRSILPVAVLPVTAVVTRLCGGPEDCAVVLHGDGSREEIALEQLPEFVAQQRNPDNVKEVATVDVQLADLGPFGNIRFVDTPGLGSVYAHNTKTSVEWLPKVGAALVAISAESPLSAQDLELLRDAMRYSPEMAILLTKADQVSPRELEDVIAFLAQQTALRVGKNLPILPYSILPGHETHRDRLKAYLLERLAARHDEAAGEILRHKIAALVSGCRDYLRVAEQAATAAEEARAQLARLLAEERQRLRSVRHEIWLLAADLKSRLRDTAAKESQTYRSGLLARLLEDLDAQPSLRKGTLRRTTAACEAWMEAALRRELESVSREEGARLRQFLTEAESSLTRVVRAFQDRLSQRLEEALHTCFSGAAFHAAIAPPNRPDVSVGRLFDVPVEMLGFLVPMWLFRPLVMRHFRRGLPWQAEKNLYRLAAQWADAYDRSIDGLARQAQEFIENEMATVERLVSGADSQLSPVRQAIAELQALESGQVAAGGAR